MSTAWAWIKGAGSWLVGGSSSLYLYGALAGAAVAGAALWHNAKVESGYQRGYSVANSEHKAAENRALLVQAERIATLSNDLTEALAAYGTVSNNLTTARVEYRYRGERVRAAVQGDELDRRLGAAECGVARTFAAGAFRTAATCRNDLAEVGLGVGGLVEASASAQYEHDRAEALRRYYSPFTSLHNPTAPAK
jgi:hypothetical protein